MACCWMFGEDTLNLEKFYERSTVKYNIIDDDVMMDLQKKGLFLEKKRLSKLVKVVHID